MTEHALPLAMVAALIAGIFTGYPVAFVLGGIGILFMAIGDIPLIYMGTVASRISGGILENWLLIAVPLFVFMGMILERAGIAQNLLISLEALFGRLHGGLGVSVAVLGIVLAAGTGSSGASVVMLSVLALPHMLAQGYSKALSSGVVAASGTLGIIIPPSIMLVLMGAILQISVGDLFKAALVPGLVLGALYAVFILLTGWVRPQLAPVGVPGSESQPLGRQLVQLARDLVGPAMLITAVLGSIVGGIATPTEAAGVGAAGAMVLAALSRQLKWGMLREAVRGTSATTGMIIFVMIGATCFSAVFKRLGGDTMIEQSVTGTGMGPYGIILLLMAIIFFLGFFLEWVEISFVVLPLFAPIVSGLDFPGVAERDILVWFTILVAVNLQTSFLTPPFGYALFYVRGAAPEGINTLDIYRGVIPFVGLQLLCLAVLIVWPDFALGLVRTLRG